MSETIKNEIQRRFGDVAANYTTSAVHAAGADLTAMVDLADLRGHEQVLDVGCGAGHTALAFAARAAHVVALDITPAMLEQVAQNAAARGLSNVETRLGDVEAIDAPDASFDIVTSRYSAHHYPDPVRALAEIRRVLKPGGLFLLSDIVASEAPVEDTFLQTIEFLRDGSHVRDHRVSDWLRMMAAAELQARVVGTGALPLAFDAWVERINTPAPQVAMLRLLFDQATDDLRAAFAIQPDYTFSIPGALFMARTPAQA